LLIAFFLVYICRAIVFVGYARTWEQFAVTASSAALFDALFRYLRQKKLIFPTSGIVASIGIVLIVDTPSIGYYVLLAFLAMGSKQFLRWNGRHIFNPSNFSILVVSLGLASVVAPNPARFGGGFEWTLIVFVLGAIVTWKVDRWLVSLSYYWAFFLGCLVRSLIRGVAPMTYAIVMLGPGFQLLSFLMMTDPKTSPNRHRLQILFGVTAAILDNVFRFYQLRLSVYIAIFITTLLYAIVDYYTRDSVLETPWKERSIQFGTGKKASA
jgi:Na+-translocating ferredoxin:NAD+ oxidoreductase RnfD subunit